MAKLFLTLITSFFLLSGCGTGDALFSSDGHKAAQSTHNPDEPRPFDKSRNAMADIDAALSASQVSGKNVLLVLGGNWCHDSRGLAAKFQRPELNQIIENNFELVWVDVGHRDRNLDVSKRFSVDELVGTPTILIVSPQEELLNADTVHDWRTAHDRPYSEAVEYFGAYSMLAQ